jgi:hypothetical protein
MIVLGSSDIVCEDIEYLEDIKKLPNTKSGSTVVVDFTDKKELIILQKESIPFGVIVSSIKEAIIVSSYGAKYIICKNNLADTLQKIADNYLFDSKIIEIITNNKELENSAIAGVDGVIFKNFITKAKKETQ